MLTYVLLTGLVIFGASSAYFYVADRKEDGLNSAFLVSFITLISYALMWQGGVRMMTKNGEPILWTRWLFYAASCTLLMVEIGKPKDIRGGLLAEWIYLTAIVMVTGTLAALDLTATRWLYFVLSSVAYALLVAQVLTVQTAGSGWINRYVLFGWTVFPIVFVLAPTGVGLVGAAVANLLYLALDVYTKIVFNLQLRMSSSAAQ